MTKMDKIEESGIKTGTMDITTEATSVITGTAAQAGMTKMEKMVNCITEKFGVNAHIFKSGGRWSVMPGNGHSVDSVKMKEVREYVTSHSEELEEEDDDT